MGSTRAFLTGTILGAGAMYFFDPRLGNRRRVLIEDKLRRLSRKAAHGIDVGLRDLNNRVQGTAHEVGAFANPRSRSRQIQPRGPGRIRRTDGTDWAPGARLIGAAAGTALMANCAIRRKPSAMLLGTLGFALFTRAVANKP